MPLFFFACASCKKVKLKKGDQNISFLALGDSYTIGESVDIDLRWPKQLVKKLKSQDVLIEPVKIIAKTGWRTDQLLLNARTVLNESKFDLVALLIGVNNEFQGETIESFEEKFRKCLAFAIAQARSGEAGVFVLSIPDYGFTPYGAPNQDKISARIDGYNNICKSVSLEFGVAYFDITAISRQGLIDTKLVATDNLHPSGYQYSLWVDRYYQNILGMIQSNLNN